MSSHLCISIRFLRCLTHGRDEDGAPEWPLSPLRLIQALVAAGSGRWNERIHISTVVPAIHWLERQRPPMIVAPNAVPSSAPCQFYVPDNTGELVVPSWKRGEFSAQVNRSEKIVRPNHLESWALHYLYPLGVGEFPHLEVIMTAARSITHLGWGIDQVVGDACCLSDEQATELAGRRWTASPHGGTPLRVPKVGTLDDLMRKHADFLQRVTPDGFRPVPPLRVFDIVNYRRQDEPIARPYRVFELRTVDGERFRYPQSKFIHIAGMVRHLAIEAMKSTPPRGVESGWVETYVAGHRPVSQPNLPAKDKCLDEATIDAQREGLTVSDLHRQLSYLPLPSIGMQHTDPGVRRVMIAAPFGDDKLLDSVARRLAGQQLEPEGDEFHGKEPPLLIPVKHDNVAKFYTLPAKSWASVTPVILPGHDDHRPAKTRKLIEKALAQSGIDQPCEFEWSAFSHFPKSLSAHKYDRNKRSAGYFRPYHLKSNTAVHLTIRFGHREDPNDKESRWIPADVPIPGPLVIGAGRHCGFGLMAAIDSDG